MKEKFNERAADSLASPTHGGRMVQGKKNVMTERFRDALRYGAELHEEQMRKGGDIPYVGHLLIVAGTVIEWGCDEDTAIAAVLHDAIEDQSGKQPGPEIRRRFGDRVAEMVEGLSDADTIPKPPWLERKKAYFERLRKEADEVVLISAADKLHNARAILADYLIHGESLWKRFSVADQGAGPQLWYLKNLLDIYEDRLGERFTRELRAVTEELAQRTGFDLDGVPEPGDAPTDDPKAQLVEHRCWETTDRVTGDPEMTAFRRRARLQQALWREKQQLPIGGQKQPDGTVRPIGSRIETGFAWNHGANFLSNSIRSAVDERLGRPEKHQMINEDRLMGDLLSSMPMCFNLFGELAGDANQATQAVKTWLEELPGRVSEVRFEWSPGRLDPSFLGNRSAFDCAFLLDAGGANAVVGIETKYHEVALKEPPPSENRLPRYFEVTERSKVFKPGWQSSIVGSDLQQIWLDHLLVLSMLQNGYGWGRFMLVYPERNISFARAAARYRDLLQVPETFVAITIEELLDSRFLSPELEAAFRERYLW